MLEEEKEKYMKDAPPSKDGSTPDLTRFRRKVFDPVRKKFGFPREIASASEKEMNYIEIGIAGYTETETTGTTKRILLTSRRLKDITNLAKHYTDEHARLITEQEQRALESMREKVSNA